MLKAYLCSSIMTSSSLTMLEWHNSFSSDISLIAVVGTPSSSFSSLENNSYGFDFSM
ncbi:unnamed protein product [Acanthoscelides obtectus]|uniref:Uncharacterized protein n=1 Tax=Acanthoscelides obtectus TaxID=200917 RepID=A0A9P0KTI2_ACAOB|nr:unnamed protein product [Acanthoscelides obtectus]CAK1678312.1 hypothetical protein AOBTE_LOCUS31816 [Acanthoscelides obtectus]